MLRLHSHCIRPGFGPGFAARLRTGLLVLGMVVGVVFAGTGESNAQTTSHDPLPEQQRIIPGEWLVQLVPATADGPSAEALLQGLMARHPRIHSWTVLSAGLGLYRLDGEACPDAKSRQTFLHGLGREDAVLRVQANHRLQRREIPSDPSFNLQWGMLNPGGSGTEDADIDATEAWDITTGGLNANGDSIVIAVIDDGFDLDHEDLWFWTNRSEIPGDGLDNDGNGYTDDYVGWNPVQDTSHLPLALHGTHVCGIAAARGNNGIGVSGVNWSTAVLPVYSTLEEDDVVAAYAYVHAMRKRYDQTGGAQGAYVVVTNSSFGVDFADPADYPIWCAMYDSLGALGILSPAATINANLNVDAIGDVPTACESPFMIAVTNTNDNDNLQSAGYGATTIDLGAPGTGVYSTTPGNNYGFNTGTSMATPHVAGTIALMHAAACERFANDYALDPPGMALLMKHYLLIAADPVADLHERSVSDGRLNVFKAIDSMLENYCRASGGISTGTPSGESMPWRILPNPAPGAFQVAWSESRLEESELVLLDLAGRVLQRRRVPAGTTQLSWDPGALPSGSYLIRDARGHVGKLLRP